MRGPLARGDSVVVSTVAGASHKAYPLARIPNNVSYEDVSDQPEAQPNQPVSVPISFHGGMAYDKYDPEVGGYVYNGGFIVSEKGVIRAPLVVTDVALTGAVNVVNYAFEADVNDSGDDDGRPRLFLIACEAAEINVYKISLAYGYTATGTGVTTDTASTLEDDRAAWTTDEWIGEIVYCNSQEMTITSNTATVLTGSGEWDGDPGDGNAYKIGVGDYGTLLSVRTFALTPTQPMGRPALWYDGTNTQWRLPTGDTTNDIQSLTSIVSGTAADTWEPADSGACDADARHLRVVGEKLYRTTGKNEVCILQRDTDPSTESNWGGEFYVGSDATNITDIGEAGGLSYIAKEDGLYEWDGESTADNVLPEIGSSPLNGQGMVYWHGGFLIPTATGLWWTRTGEPVGPDSNPQNRGNFASLQSAAFFQHGRWLGLATFGAYVYGLYSTSLNAYAYYVYGRERDESDPPGWGPIIWHTIGLCAANLTDFHGLRVTERSEFSTSETRPCLWGPGSSVSNAAYIWLDKDGTPRGRRGDINVAATGLLYSGDIDFECPRVLKQLHLIDGWAEDMEAGATDHSFRFGVMSDGGSAAWVGAAINSDGYFQRYWTQDTSDTARSLLLKLAFTAGTEKTGVSGPHLRNPVLRAVAMPNTTRVWTFLLTARDEAARTGKTVRSELEGYRNDLKKYELPDGDSFNGVLTGLRLLRADELYKLTPRNQEPPHYVIEATVREMVTS